MTTISLHKRKRHHEDQAHTKRICNLKQRTRGQHTARTMRMAIQASTADAMIPNMPLDIKDKLLVHCWSTIVRSLLSPVPPVNLNWVCYTDAYVSAHMQQVANEVHVLEEKSRLYDALCEIQQSSVRMGTQMYTFVPQSCMGTYHKQIQTTEECVRIRQVLSTGVRMQKCHATMALNHAWDVLCGPPHHNGQAWRGISNTRRMHRRQPSYTPMQYGDALRTIVSETTAQIWRIRRVPNVKGEYMLYLRNSADITGVARAIACPVPRLLLKTTSSIIKTCGILPQLALLIATYL